MAHIRADHGRRSAWARLTEERFTNVDLIVVLGALVITCLVGALSGVTIFG